MSPPNSKINSTGRAYSEAGYFDFVRPAQAQKKSLPVVAAPDSPPPVSQSGNSGGFGFASKLFHTAFELTRTFLGVDAAENQELQKRRQLVHETLLEIHPAEYRLGRRSPKELENDPFVQTLRRVDEEVAAHVRKLLKDPPEDSISAAELRSLYASTHVEAFFQKFAEVREEILGNDPAYVRQKALEDGIQRISHFENEIEVFAQEREALINRERETDPKLVKVVQEYRESLLSRSETIKLIREDLEAAVVEVEMEEETQTLANEDYSSNLGDGEADEPGESIEKEPSEAVLSARQKLAFFNGLIEELEWLEFDSGEDLATSLEELEGIVRDFSAYEEEWVWNQLEGRLESIEGLDGKHPKVKELREAIEELKAKEGAGPNDYHAVITKAEEAALWTSVEERIRLYSEMHDSAGMTDGIIALGRGVSRALALISGGPLAYEFFKSSNADIDGASAYLEMQTKYIDVHRLLTEGKYEEARKLFVRLENSKEHALLLDGYKDSQRVNQCTVTAAIVTASAATAGIATELIGGAATALGATRGLNLLKFATNATAFTVAERGYTSWVYDKNFIDPKLSGWDNAQGLGWDIAMNAGMFAFLGGAFRLFEKHLLLPLAKARALSKTGTTEAKLSADLVQAEREALLKQVTTGIPLRLGRFSTELLAFGFWDAIARNFELNRKNFQEGNGFGLVFPAETLFSLQAWEERFVFLIALKAGGLLAAPLAKPVHEGLGRWFDHPKPEIGSGALPEAAPADPTQATPLSEADLIFDSTTENGRSANGEIEFENAAKRVPYNPSAPIREHYEWLRGIPPRTEKNPERLFEDPALLMGLNGWHNVPIGMRMGGFPIVGEDFKLLITQTEGGNIYLKAVSGDAHILVQGDFQAIGKKGVLLRDGDLLRLGNQDFIWKNPHSKNPDVLSEGNLIDRDIDLRMGVQDLLTRHTRILGSKTREAFLAQPEYYEEVSSFERGLEALQESFHELERMEGELVDGEFPAAERYERTRQVEEKWEEVQILYEEMNESWYENRMLRYEVAVAEARKEIAYLEFRLGKRVTDYFMDARERRGENLDLDWEVIATPPEKLMKYAEDGYEGISVSELLSLRVKVDGPEMAREILSMLEAEGNSQRESQADLLLAVQEEYDRLSAPMLELAVESESDFQKLEAMEKELEPIEAALDRLQQIKFARIHKPLKMDRERGLGSAILELSPVDDTSRIYVKIQFQMVEAPELQKASGI